MGKRDPRIDAYIAARAPFARPLLKRLRAGIRAVCPLADEALKWGMPAFVVDGHIVCGIAGFKAHAALWFWKGSSLAGPGGERGKEAMGQFGRLTTIAQLPSRRVLAGYVKQVLARHASDATAAPRTRAKQPRAARVPPVPADLARALARHAKARTTFRGFPPGHRREYIEWITGARRPETRARRLATALEWLAEGKPHNWRYMARRGSAAGAPRARTTRTRR